MRILHILHTGGIAGAERHLLDLIPALKKRGIDGELICICPVKYSSVIKPYCDQATALNIKTTLIISNSVLSVFNTARKVAKYIKENNIKYVHSHLFNADLVAVLVKRFSSNKFVLFSTKHGYRESYLVQYGLGNKKVNKDFYYQVSKAVNKRIDFNLAASKAIADLYDTLDFGIEKMDYIHHGINPPVPGKKVLSLSGNPRIMIVARLSEIKGHKFLFDAMPAVIAKFPAIKLYVLGVGPESDSLKEYVKKINIQDNIEFVGFANGSDYAPHCQLMLLPSLFESFGLVYIESFAMKIPVIAFDAEAANQIIENEKTGILVPKGNSTALAAQIIAMLQSDEKRKFIAQNAYHKYLEFYTVDRMAEETKNWYAKCLTDSGYNKV